MHELMAVSTQTQIANMPFIFYFLGVGIIISKLCRSGHTLSILYLYLKINKIPFLLVFNFHLHSFHITAFASKEVLKSSKEPNTVSQSTHISAVTKHFSVNWHFSVDWIETRKFGNRWPNQYVTEKSTRAF